MGAPISKEEGLNKLIKYFNKLGRIPTKTEFKQNYWTPNYGWYARKYGSMEEACFTAGLIEKPLTEQERIDISIKQLVDLSNKLNKCPTVSDYESLIHKGYSRRDLEKHLKLKYNDICRKYIPQHSLNVNNDYTKEHMIEKLTEIYKKLGRSPMFNELAQFGIQHGIKCIVKYFKANTYNDVIKELGWEPSYSTTKAKSEEQMLNEFYEYFQELNRVPYVEELNTNGKTATYTTYVKYFGSIENICELLDIDFSKYYIPNCGFNIVFDDNSDICRSIMEARITNYLIYNKIKYTKEVKYNELLNTNDNRRFDWKIEYNNNDYYIEYAGLYSNHIKYIGNKYNDKINMKIKDLTESGFIDKCYFIYPSDVKDKTLRQIFESILGVTLKDEISKKIQKQTNYSLMSDNDLLKEILKYQTEENNNILPSTSILARKASRLYSEIITRYKTYDNFAKQLNMKTISPNKNCKTIKLC